MSNRLKQLENSLKFHQFTYNIEDELNWIREREHQTASTDLGSNLTGVQTLLAKHEVNIINTILSLTVCFIFLGFNQRASKS